MDSSSRQICRYDVFISFRGTDTRNTFVDHLYHHLIGKGLLVFKDDIELRKGELISPQLVQAIQDSRVSVVVFSEDYASSSWCLDEMATIADCHQQFKQTVFPVFYHMDPSHIRKQNGVYENAFISHNEKFKQDPGKVGRWKTAMTNLGNSNGWHVEDYKPEVGEIEKIVQAIIKALGHKLSGIADDLIGIQPHIKKLEKLLKLSSENDDFRVLGIWGMGGIGKTTHAAVLYNRISYQFVACCFIENVSKVYRDGGAIAVHKQILHQTLGEKNLEAYSPSEIFGIVRNRLHNLKVLIVLDNVDCINHLSELAIKPLLLIRGSRMIITTRDEHILKVYGAHSMYKVPLLNKDDACELFCKKAFKSEDQSSGCVELIPEVLKYVQGLPLAIRVLGSNFCVRDATHWRSALDRLMISPDNEIMDVLQISVDGLPYEEKEIFLHVACFFQGEREDFVKRILNACELHPHIGIQRMIEKSLITIRNQEIHMHEILQELGKKIVRHQYPKRPGRWSRLWLYRDFYHVLSTEMESNDVEAIVLDPKEDVHKCRAEGLGRMKSLRLLILYHDKFSGSLNFLSNNLQYLLWHGYPFTSLPPYFEPLYIVELHMPDSSIKRLWDGPKELPYLKRVDLNNSKYLLETPNFEGCQNLERLDFTGCTSLLRVHPSIGLLENLAFLSLRNCSNLVSISCFCVSKLCSLRVLHLSGCTKLESTPDFTGALNLEYLDIDRCTSLTLVHESIGALTKLRFLSLRDCTNLVSIPSSINTMTSLITLDLCGSKLMNLPLRSATSNSSSLLKSLIFLDLSFCNLLEVPHVIGQLECLERLNLQGNKFVSIPSTMAKLSSLAYLNLSHCHELKCVPKLPIKSSSLVGRYFKTTSGSRDHRSGLYIFNCPKLFSVESTLFPAMSWLSRLLKEPRHFRCGFDIVVPTVYSGSFPRLFCPALEGDSTIRVMHRKVHDDWLGFAFWAAFEVNDPPRISGFQHLSSSSSLPHPFYLSFESECTEHRFDMPLNLELNKIVGSHYNWMIYISREHCHFIETGAHITFKACPGLVVKQWGLRRIVKQDIDVPDKSSSSSSSSSSSLSVNIFGHKIQFPYNRLATDEDRLSSIERYIQTMTDGLVIANAGKSRSSSYGPKIQLPYNWLVTEEDEVENLEAKAKENNLSNLGLR